MAGQIISRRRSTAGDPHAAPLQFEAPLHSFGGSWSETLKAREEAIAATAKVLRRRSTPRPSAA